MSANSQKQNGADAEFWHRRIETDRCSELSFLFNFLSIFSTNFLFELVSAHRREMQLNSNVVSRVRVAQRTQWKAAWEWRSLSSHRGAEWRALEGPQQLYFPFFS